MSKSKLTRSQLNDPIVGVLRGFSGNVLPSHEDVLKCYLWLRHDMKQDSRKEPTVSEISNMLTEQLIGIWNKASIPTLSEPRIKSLIQKYHGKYMTLMKQPKAKLNSEAYRRNLKLFKEDAAVRLFDIAACKCNFAFCKCEKSRKVPPHEREFLTDQRTTRRMFIGRVDLVMSKKLSSRESRRVKKGNTPAGESGTVPENDVCPPVVVDSDTESDEQEEFEAPQKHRRVEEFDDQSGTSKQPQMRIKLPTVARTCDRFGVSNRAAAAIASAVLQDVGVVTKQDTSRVIDKRKIQRERVKARVALRQADQKKSIRALFFDGRKDKTLTLEKHEGRNHRRTITEEHLALVEEPGSHYLGHVTPSSGSAESIKEAIMTFFSTNEIPMEHLVCVGCDGTNVNTGSRGGVLRLLELELKRPLQWFICQLHGNELTLRHLLHHLDGNTSGPLKFSGYIGKLLEKCEMLPVQLFEVVDCNLQSTDSDDLSSDQKYLWEICHVISSGNCPPSFSKREPGKLSHARWLTTANRILRLYIGTEEPTDNLKILTQFILKVYAPVWFSVKTHSSCKDGARHTWLSISLTRYLSDDLKKVVDAVIQRNAYFAHPENILLSMITDERRHVRELGLRRILKSRQNKNTSTIRQFKIPPLNFAATDYIDMIDWQNTISTEPPILKETSSEELRELIYDQEKSMLNFSRFPCHTQAVERCVKLITEASTSVIGQDTRDGFIRAKIKSRQDLPNFETKSDFQVI